MTSIRKVAVLEASGNLGKSIVLALLKAGFDLTVISRRGGQAYIPPVGFEDAKAITVEATYNDIQSLINALKDQDALVETYNLAAVVHQRNIVRAALAAGVKHLITNEFGVDPFGSNAAELPVAQGKIDAHRTLEEELQTAADSGKPVSLAWTGIVTGIWFDWALRLRNEHIFWIYPAKRTIIRYGSGNQETCWSHVGTNGDAVITVLHDPGRFENRSAYFASYTVTTNEVIAFINQIGGNSDKPWDIVEIPDMEAYKAEGLRRREEDEKNGIDKSAPTQAFLMQVIAGIFDEKNYCGFGFGDKVEPSWDRGHEKLKEQLQELIEEVSR